LENKQGEKEGVSRGTFLLFSYLYFIQGVIIGLIGTMPYIYPTLPDVDTMALFNSITLPYSFKFLIGTPTCTQRRFSKNSRSSSTASARPGSSLVNPQQQLSFLSLPSTRLKKARSCSQYFAL
jgi:hypothetical protein